MATRTKTLWYATKLAADVVEATVTNLDQITVYADTGRTFRSALVWVAAQDIITATGGTIGEYRVGLRLGSASYTTITELDDLTHSGENLAVVLGPFDFTAHFTANFGSGASQTLDLQVYFDQTTGTTLNLRNVCALIAITIEYDDAGATQYQTAIIPLESPTGALPTTETELGTNQIPQLTGTGGLLEGVASVTVRDQFFLIEGNEANNAGTTNWTLSCRIDTGTTLNFGQQVAALASDRYCWWLHKETPTPDSAHQFRLWISAGGVGRLNMAVVTMFVTYEFAVSGTTAMLNSVLIPVAMPSPIAGTAAADLARSRFTFFVEEPATIALRQSAVRLYFSAPAAVSGLACKVGGQTARTYTHAASVTCGAFCLQQRIDSGGAQGAGLSLARGENTLTVDAYHTDSADWPGLVSVLLILNYRSGVASQGLGAHQHTTVWRVGDFDAALSLAREYAAAAPTIPESAYWVTQVGLWAMVAGYTVTAATLGIHAERLSGEGAADGWEALYDGHGNVDNELGFFPVFVAAGRLFRRHPGDPDTGRLAIGGSRKYRVYAGSSISSGLCLLLTYHAITFTLSGTVSGYGAGDGSGIQVDAHRKDTGEKLYQASTSAGGGFSVTAYDNTLTMKADARRVSGEAGRSDDGVAS